MRERGIIVVAKNTFGFIERKNRIGDEETIFVHKNDFSDRSCKNIQVGHLVEFDWIESKKKPGSKEAANVVIHGKRELTDEEKLRNLGRLRGKGKSNASEKESKKKSVDYNSMTVVQLKEILRERGLKVSGVKAELISRLEDDDKPKKKKKKVRIDYNTLTVVELKAILKERNLPTVGLKAALVSRLIHDDKPKKKSLVIPSQIQEDRVHPHNIVHDGNLEKNQEYLLDRLNTGHSLLIYCLNEGDIATRVKLTKLQATTEKSFSSFVVKPMSWPHQSINKVLGMNTHPLMSRMICSAVIVSSREIIDESPFISILAQKVHEHFLMKGRNQQAWTILGDETGSLLDYQNGQQWTGEGAVPSSMLWVIIPPKSHGKIPMLHPYFHAIEARFYEDTKAGIAALAEHEDILCFVFSYEAGKLPENLLKNRAISSSKHLAMWQYTLPLVLETLSQRISHTKNTDIDIFLERVGHLVPGLESGTILQQFSVALSNRKGWGKMVVRDSPVIAKKPLEHGWLGYPDVLGHLLWPQNTQAYGKTTSEQITVIKNRWIRAPFRQDSLSGPIHQALMDTARPLGFLKSLSSISPEDIRDYIIPFFSSAIPEAISSLNSGEWQDLLEYIDNTSRDKQGQRAAALIHNHIVVDATLEKMERASDRFDLLRMMLGTSNHRGAMTQGMNCKEKCEGMLDSGFEPTDEKLQKFMNLLPGLRDNMFDFDEHIDSIPEYSSSMTNPQIHFLGTKAQTLGLTGDPKNRKIAIEIEEKLAQHGDDRRHHRRHSVLLAELLLDEGAQIEAAQTLLERLLAKVPEDEAELLKDSYFLAAILKTCALINCDESVWDNKTTTVRNLIDDDHPSQRIAYWCARWAVQIGKSESDLAKHCFQHLLELTEVPLFSHDAPGLTLSCELLDLVSRGYSTEFDVHAFYDLVVENSQPSTKKWVSQHPPNADDWLAPLNFNYR